MKASILAVALASVHLVGLGQTCVKMEYAELKDSTKKELSAEYCSLMAKAELHEKLAQIQRDSFRSGNLARGASNEAMKSAEEHGNQQVACLRAAESASSMLQKKFKAKATCNKG